MELGKSQELPMTTEVSKATPQEGLKKSSEVSPETEGLPWGKVLEMGMVHYRLVHKPFQKLKQREQTQRVQ